MAVSLHELTKLTLEPVRAMRLNSGHEDFVLFFGPPPFRCCQPECNMRGLSSPFLRVGSSECIHRLRQDLLLRPGRQADT